MGLLWNRRRSQHRSVQGINQRIHLEHYLHLHPGFKRSFEGRSAELSGPTGAGHEGGRQAGYPACQTGGEIRRFSSEDPINHPQRSAWALGSAISFVCSLVYHSVWWK